MTFITKDNREISITYKAALKSFTATVGLPSFFGGGKDLERWWINTPSRWATSLSTGSIESYIIEEEDEVNTEIILSSSSSTSVGIVLFFLTQ